MSHLPWFHVYRGFDVSAISLTSRKRHRERAVCDAAYDLPDLDLRTRSLPSRIDNSTNVGRSRPARDADAVMEES